MNDTENQEKTANVENTETKDATKTKGSEPNNIIVAEEATEILNNENIINTLKKYKADTKEKEIALEYAKSHIQCIRGLVESDIKNSIYRKDIEIRDIISHLNMMLKKKDEYIFSTMVINSPSHYRTITEDIIKTVK